MQIELLYRPAFSLGIIHLDGGEQVRVEAASMVSMSQAKSMKLIEMNNEMLSVSEPMREMRSPVRFLLK